MDIKGVYVSKKNGKMRKVIDVKPDYNKKWIMQVTYVTYINDKYDYREEDFFECELKTFKAWIKNNVA